MMVKPFAVWRLKTGLYWNYNPTKAKIYLIVIWVLGIDGARDSYEVRTDGPCTIKNLLPILLAEKTEVFKGVTDGKVVDSGFECYIM